MQFKILQIQVLSKMSVSTSHIEQERNASEIC